MMKIAVCFKVLADYQRLSTKDWEWNESNEVDTGFVRQIFNCYDESALEMALNLSDGFKKNLQTAKLTAMTIDGPRAEVFLRHLAAVGYDDLIRIQCKEGIDLRFNPIAVSCLIAAYTRQEHQDLVLFGTQGADGDNRQTGLLVAEQLHWPCIRDVEKIEPGNSSKTLRVVSQTQGGTLLQTVKLPAVLIVGQSLETPYLRLPNLRQKLNAKKRKINLLSENDLGIDDIGLLDNDKTLIRLESRQSDHVCIFLNGSSPEEQARHLFDSYLKKRLFP